MDPYQTEEAQLESVKRFISHYGTWIAFVVVAVLVWVVGSSYWHTRQQTISNKASMAYQALLDDMQKGANTADAKAQVLYEHYPNTPYAHWAMIIRARLMVSKNEYTQAITLLQDYVASKPPKMFAQMARINLARALMQQKRTEEAIKVLNAVKGDPFAPWAQAVLGQAYAMREANDKAREAFSEALKGLPIGDPGRQYIQMQLDDLPAAS